jgi:pimeloyl-ACP methyl ester carboxylesterase
MISATTKKHTRGWNSTMLMAWAASIVFAAFVSSVVLDASSVDRLASGRTPHAAALTFRVTIDPSVRKEPASGRVIVMLIRDGARIQPGAEPLAGPFWRDPQPMFAVDASNVKPGDSIVLDDSATSFPGPMSSLPPGEYRAQARIDLARTNSAWRRDPGNVFSKVVRFTIPADARNGAAKTAAGGVKVELKLDQVVTAPSPKARPGIEVFQIRSELLSKFHGRDVFLRAGVAFPVDFDAARKYPAVYDVPGFGGDHMAVFAEDRTKYVPASIDETLVKSTFWIFLDAESPNGHTLFADSANNGPWGAALTTELIPALEQRFALIPTPSARLLRGHSSGGWSTLWLALTYPEVFGGCWSSAPDPVDFRRFQLVDIYEQPNFYYRPGGAPGNPDDELVSYVKGGQKRMSIRQENMMEEVLGPDNTSAQQWDSWFAAFGPKDDRGRVAALFDPATGVIDHALARHYRAYDIGHLLRSDPKKYLPIFRDRVRLVVGDEDSFSLHEAVRLLKADLEKLGLKPDLRKQHPPEAADQGYIVIAPGYDHGTVLGAPEVRKFDEQIVRHLQAAGHIPAK